MYLQYELNIGKMIYYSSISRIISQLIILIRLLKVLSRSINAITMVLFYSKKNI
jgi:hypothetical protein